MPVFNDTIVTTTKNKNNNSNNNNNNTISNNNSNNIQDTITPNPSPNPSENEPPHASTGEWQKGTTLFVGDMISGLREAKLSRNRKVKVRFLPGAKAEDIMFYLISYPDKKSDNIIIYIGTNDGPYSNENTIYVEIKKIKEMIKNHHPDCRNIFISSPILRLDNNKASNALKNYINDLKREEHNIILDDNINESHLHRDGLHLNIKGTIALAENFISRIRRF